MDICIYIYIYMYIYIVKFVEVGDLLTPLTVGITRQLWMFLGVCLSHWDSFFKRKPWLEDHHNKAAKENKHAPHSQDACYVRYWISMTLLPTGILWPWGGGFSYCNNLCLDPLEHIPTRQTKKTNRTSLVSLWVLSWWHVATNQLELDHFSELSRCWFQY